MISRIVAVLTLCALAAIGAGTETDTTHSLKIVAPDTLRKLVVVDTLRKNLKRSDTVLVVKHAYEHREQIVTGGVIMACLVSMMVIMNNYNPH